MITDEKKEEFIKLRSLGYSFDKISASVGVSKPTLIKLNIELENAIDNKKYENYQVLLEEYELTKHKRIEYLCKELKKVYGAIASKGYEDISMKDLQEIKLKLVSQLEKEVNCTKYYTDELEPIEESDFSLYDYVNFSLE